MGPKKLTQLTEATSLLGTALLYAVKDPDTVPTSVKVKLDNLIVSLPDASTTVRGLVSTGTQTFAGAKTFSGAVSLSGTLAVTGTTTLGGHVTLSDVNLVLGVTAGTKFGTATTQKIGLWNATPVVQPSSTGETLGFIAGTGTAVNDASTFTGNVGTVAYRISDVVKHLKNIGLLAS